MAKEHERTECGNREVLCPLDCGEIVAGSLLDSEEHQKHHCGMRLVPCGNGCGETIKFKDLEVHKSTVCPMKMSACRLCYCDVVQGEMEQHEKHECKCRMIFCRFGCGETVR